MFEIKSKLKALQLKQMLLIVMGLNIQIVSAQTVTVGYFMEWPTPNQFAQVNKIYQDKLGVDVKWVAFDSGTAMSAAMASGDVNISFSQGVPPFVVAVSAGQAIQVVDVAVSYSENDNCVVHGDLEIDKTNVKELEGKKVAVPIGTAAHYGFLKQMAHFSVDVSTMKIVDMDPASGAAAFSSGTLDMVCGWGGALQRMKEYGNVLMNGKEKEQLGIQVFDVTSVPVEWAEKNEALLSKFLAVTSTMNMKFLKQKNTMIPVIAKAAGMDEKTTHKTMSGFEFPSIEKQLSKKWLGGGTQVFLKQVADFFVSQGVMKKSLESYDDAVNNEYLQQAKKDI